MTKVLDPSLCLNHVCTAFVALCLYSLSPMLYFYCTTPLQQREDKVYLRPEAFQFTLDLCCQEAESGHDAAVQLFAKHSNYYHFNGEVKN